MHDGSSAGLLRPLLDPLFRHIAVDPTWPAQVRDAAARGPVVYVLRNLSLVDSLALDAVTRRAGLPQVGFVNELGIWSGDASPLRMWQRFWRTPSVDDDVARLRHAALHGQSAALFLKRPANLLEPKVRGRIEGDRLLRSLIELEHNKQLDLQLCPQVFLWSRGPDTAGTQPLDAVFGPREWPGALRTAAQFALNYRHVTLRGGEPLSLQSFLRKHQGEPDEVLLRRLIYTLLRRIERERRVVTGPRHKPIDRVRTEVIRSPKLQKALAEVADVGDPARGALLDKVTHMLEQMEAAPDPAVVPLLDQLYQRTVGHMISELAVDRQGLERLRELSKDATLVLLPNHRSHVDYLVLAKVWHDASLPLPVVAAGDNLNFRPVGPLLRRAGAFYLRRSFRGDKLYALVLEAYVRRLLRNGQALEFFLEGGRSRTGRLLPPMRGLLTMVVDAALGSGRPVHFCPIAISYDRVPEQRAYVGELTGARKERESAKALLGARRVLSQRYGCVAVQFGEPIALEQLRRELLPAGADAEKLTPPQRRALVTQLATCTMQRINQSTAIPAGAIAATCLLSAEARNVAHPQLLEDAARLIALLAHEGARFAGQHPMDARAIEAALSLYCTSKWLQAHRAGAPLGSRERNTTPGAEALYHMDDAARVALAIAAGCVLDRLFELCVLALCLCSHATPEGGWDELALRELVEQLAELIRPELAALAWEPRTVATTALERARALGWLRPGATGRWTVASEADELLRLLARRLEPTFEAYWVVATALVERQGLEPQSLEKWTRFALWVGDKLHAKGELHCREALMRPSLDNAWQRSVELGYLTRDRGELRIAAAFEDRALRSRLRARLAPFRLPRPR